jgi:hypothetical protein
VRQEMDYSNNRHLWDEYLIDAHGVQVLTSRHLEHAADLTDWLVEQIAPDRFLVSTRDLQPWFHHIGPTRPAPELLHQARADFGSMILDWNTIKARPGPWTNIGSNVFGR